MGDDTKPRIYRDMCAALDIADLAREGWLAPGIHDGTVGSFVMDDEEGIAVPIQARMGPDSGRVLVYWPDWQLLAVTQVAGPGGRPWWRWICTACERRTRRLLLPQTPPGVTPGWFCRRCWRVTYRDHRRPDPDMVAEIRQLERDLAILKRNALWIESHPSKRTNGLGKP